MTEHLIFGVSYSKHHEHIEWLMVGRDADRKLAGLFLATRSFVVDLIKTDSASFRTAVMKEKKYHKGAEVVIYDDEYLTTVPDASEANNLENLPSFSMPEDEIDAALKVAVKEVLGLETQE